MMKECSTKLSETASGSSASAPLIRAAASAWPESRDRRRRGMEVTTVMRAP